VQNLWLQQSPGQTESFLRLLKPFSRLGVSVKYVSADFAAVDYPKTKDLCELIRKKDPDIPCRLCHKDVETTLHLLNACSCPALARHRHEYDISETTLQVDSPLNLLKLAAFDLHISLLLPPEQL
jgi:hypothetical protein